LTTVTADEAKQFSAGPIAERLFKKTGTLIVHSRTTMTGVPVFREARRVPICISTAPFVVNCCLRQLQQRLRAAAPSQASHVDGENSTLFEQPINGSILLFRWPRQM
jgi:hypothetical protein